MFLCFPALSSRTADLSLHYQLGIKGTKHTTRFLSYREPFGMSGNGGMNVPAVASSNRLPPVPTRPSHQLSQINRYSSPYGTPGYGYSSHYGMSNPYNYGGFGMGYNRLGTGDNNDYSCNTFSRMAEESSRPAFQSIESIVNAFSSVSMMMESSFQAVYSSFRAVLGVADHFSRLKQQLIQVFSTAAVIRMLIYMYNRFLVFLRLRPATFAEEAWSQAIDNAVGSIAAGGPSDPKKTSWPIFMFFGIVMGGPWVIWKLISAFSSSEHSRWISGEADHFIAEATYDFTGENSDELSFKRGQNIRVAPKELQPRVKGWLLASVDGKKTGIIPANYVKIHGKQRGTMSPSNCATSSQIEKSSSMNVNTHMSESMEKMDEAFQTLESRRTHDIQPSGLQDSILDMDAEDILQDQ
ncbi:hypothetical protein ScPMuIL_006597 [Solemya velum]